MKKYILIFLLFSLSAIIYLSYPFNSHEHFVSIKDKKFFLDDKAFYPMTLNYMVSVQTDGNEFWPCVYTGYNKGFRNLYTTKDSCLMQLKADFDLVKEMGFNTIRVVSIGEETINKATGALSFAGRIRNEKNIQVELSDDKNYSKYFNALSELLNIADEAGLKVIFLTRMSVDTRSTEYHLMKLASKFKDDPTVLAYDFFNEPLYFDTLERKKEDVYLAAKRWKQVVKMYAPKQLCTIGLVGIREVFEWDPNILDVDFISFHPYNAEREQVMNEMYWYNKYVKKLWMIGETAISADNDSVSYEDQKKFAHKTLKQAYDCSAIGYSWWQYKDVEWYSFNANYMGVVTQDGQTKTKKNDLIYGTVKPVASEFKLFDPTAKKDSCICLTNYYNLPQHNQFRIKGRLSDENDKPIEGGVVMAWNQWWTKSYHTVTKTDGSFELYGDFPFYHWISSACLYTMTRGDILPDTAKTLSDKIPTINIGNLKLNRLNLDL